MTVGELIKALQQYPADLVLFSTGADGGGYDATFVSELQVVMGHKHPEVAEYPDVLPQYMNCLFVGGKDERR